MDCTNEFELDPSDIFGPGNAEGNIDPEAAVDCEIVGPSGEPVDTYVSKVEPEGPFHVSCLHNYCRDGRGSVFFIRFGQKVYLTPPLILARILDWLWLHLYSTFRSFSAKRNVIIQRKRVSDR